MKRAVFALLAAVMLSGCVSSIESAYDDQAKTECDNSSHGWDRIDCYDRVDQYRRDHR